MGVRGIDEVLEGHIPDPTVGENACQIRAAMFTDFVNSDAFEQVIGESKNTLQYALEKFNNINPSKSEKSTLNKYLNDFETKIDERVYQLITAYLLTMTREPKRGFDKSEGKVHTWEKVEEVKGLQKEGFSTANARTIEKTSKQYLANASVQFLQKKALSIHPDEEGCRLHGLVSGKNVKITDLKLCTAPCFSGAEIIVANARACQTPLVVRIHQVDSETVIEEGAVTFYFTSNGSQYCQTTKEEAAKKKAVIFCEAISSAHPVLNCKQLQKKIGRRDVIETILAFMASHPVYGGDLKRLGPPQEEAERRKFYADKALRWGCCPENPRVCRIYHMFPASLKEFITKGDDL